MSTPEAMSPQEIVQSVCTVLALLGGAASWLYQMRTKSRRDKIKLDLEILEKSNQLLGAADERTLRVRSSIERRMDEVYSDSQIEGDSSGRRRLRWADFVLFLFCVCGVAFFVWGGIAAHKGWELALAALLAFIGAGALINALDRQPDKD
ncbi:MAG: hypothetical protein HOQ32_09700 [Lysobacter sp.]|nr:hypothetical protein [Lysobacter sp.]